MEQLVEGCDVCGGEHSTETCPELGLDPAEFEDAVITRARLTLPHFLQAIDLPGNEVAVYSQTEIQPKTQFGPFEAKKTTHEFNDDGLFVLKILVKDGTSVSLDTTDENECNWMCLIRAASSQLEQNCIAYQLGTSIYYNTIKKIPAGHELLVWYAPMFARKLGKNEVPDGISKVMLNMKVIYPSVQELPESFPVPALTPQPPKQQEVPTQEPELSTDVADVVVSEAPQGTTITSFTCKRCNESFEAEQDLALHIMDHLSTTKPGNSKRGRPPKYPRPNHLTNHQNNSESKKRSRLENSSDATDEESVTEEKGLNADDSYDDNDKEFIPNFEVIKVFEFCKGKRIQPKRQLKGRRTDGYMHDFVMSTKEKDLTDEVNKKQEEKRGVSANVLYKGPKRGRGRPRKIQKLEPPPHREENSTGSLKIQNELIEAATQMLMEFNGNLANEEKMEKERLQGNEQSQGSEHVQGSELVQRTENLQNDKHSVHSTNMSDTGGECLIEGREANTLENFTQNQIPRTKESQSITDTEYGDVSHEAREHTIVTVNNIENSGSAVAGTGKSVGSDSEVSTGVNTVNSDFEVVIEIDTVNSDSEIVTGVNTVNSDSEVVTGVNTVNSDSEVMTGVNTANSDLEVVTGVNTVNSDVEVVTGVNTVNSDSEVATGVNTVNSDFEVVTGVNTVSSDSEVVTEVSTVDVESEVQTCVIPSEVNTDNVTPENESCEPSERKASDIQNNEDTLRVNGHVRQELSDLEKRNNGDDTDSGDIGTIRKGSAEQQLSYQSDSKGNQNSSVVQGDIIEDTLVVDNGDDKREDNSTENGDSIALNRGHKSISRKYHHHVCQYCGKHFMNINYLKLHLPSHTGKFQCDHCGFCYARKESLVKHKCKMKVIMPKVEHEGKMKYKCMRCQELIEDREVAYQHFKKHGKEVECPDCKQIFHRHQLMKDHDCPMAPKEVYECEICKQKFPHEKNLLRHMAMHTDIYKCNECSKTFARKDSLLKHVLVCCPSKAEDYQVFACKKCWRGFSTKLGAENHESRCSKAMCRKCKRVFDSDDLYQSHLSTCAPNSNFANESKVKFTCSECGKSFRNLSYLNRHKEIHKGHLECFLCKKKFKVREEKDSHERFCMASSAINQAGEIKCDCCDEVFTSAKFYREHYTVHTHPYSCDKCMKRFVKIGSLHTHACPTMEAKPMRCEMCDKIFPNEKSYKLHVKTHKASDYFCSICNITYSDKEAYESHMCVGPDGKPTPFVPSEQIDNGLISDKHVCHVCGRDFVSTSNLNKHMKIHGEKRVECKICFKKFHHDEYLKVHMEGVHQKKNKYQCSHCGKVLTSKPGLISHTKQFHTDTKVAYSCPKCGKIFSQKGNMKTHMYSHTKERLFHCTYCPKTFKYPDQLNKHKLIHTMANKLQCEICEKIFVKEYDLKKHTQTFHSGMMYVCNICNSRCGHKHTLYRHYKRKHPSEYHLMSDETFVNSLFQQTDDNMDAVRVENESVITIDYSGTDVQGDSHLVSLDNSILDDNTLPQVAAEALKSLSNTIVATDIQTIDADNITGDNIVGENTVITLPGEEGSYQIQNLPQQISTDGQQTVVILQIMNPQDQEHIAQEVQVQQIIDGTEESIVQEGLPEEVQTWAYV